MQKTDVMKRMEELMKLSEATQRRAMEKVEENAMKCRDHVERIEDNCKQMVGDMRIELVATCTKQMDHMQLHETDVARLNV